MSTVVAQSLPLSICEIWACPEQLFDELGEIDSAAYYAASSRMLWPLPR